MPDSPLPSPPIDIAILIKDASRTGCRAYPGRPLPLQISREPSSTRKVEQMHKGLFEDCEGPIRGLRLPLNAWRVLDRENITTLPQLTAIADRIERLPGIGATTALAIRVELGRVALLEAQSS